MDHYWHLELWDKEIIKIIPAPSKIKDIQQLIAKGEGAIISATRTIPIKNVKDFRLSDEPYQDQQLLEDGLQAFNEPVYNKDGSVVARYVKKSVPQRRWDSYYSHLPAYRLLENNDGHMVMAFRLPVHQIDRNLVQELTADETSQLTKKPH